MGGKSFQTRGDLALLNSNMAIDTISLSNTQSINLYYSSNIKVRSLGCLTVMGKLERTVAITEMGTKTGGERR